jgi:tetratricopeptide (TPR) repeat protein
MTPERWQRVRAVFDTAVSLPPSQVDGFLREQCAGDAELHSEVRRMLEEHARSGLLDRAPVPPVKIRTATAFEIGSVISGRYRILRPLGHGGMGEVYEAEDLELKEHVALKTLLPEIAADGRMISRFKQEIQLSRKLAHPNICRVFDLARHPAEGSGADTVFFLTMEFLPGETLAAKLRREGRIAPPEAIQLLDQMAAGLDSAHTAGVIHRDFKTSNVMLAESPAGVRAVLMDFGLARRVEPSDETTATMSGQLIGTIDYMAPELFTGGEASAASDIYAFGLVAYKMITGELPFQSSAPLAAVIRRAGQPVPSARTLVADLDPAWDQVLTRALDPDPARRFASARDFIRALHGDASSVTVKLPVVTRRRGIVVAAWLVLLVAAAFGWRTIQQSRARPSSQAANLYQQGVDDLHAGAYFAATKALEQTVRLAPRFALAHARLAEALLELDLTDRAGNEMLQTRRLDLSPLSRADRLKLDAVDLTITRDFEAAVSKYEDLVTNYNGSDAAVDLGHAYERIGKPDKAIETLARTAQGAGQHPLAWLRLAILFSRARITARADEAFGKAEQLYQLTSNLEGLTEVAFQRGVAATARGQFEAAAGYLQKALETSRLAGNVQQEVRVKLQLGVNANSSGDPAEAERFALQALETAHANRVDPLAIRALITLGGAASRRRDNQSAQDRYQEALSLARSISSPRYAAMALLSLAALHDRQSRSEDAIREASEALSFYEPNRYAKEAIQCLIILGRAHMQRGDSDNALQFSHRAVTKLETARDEILSLQAEELIGRVLTDLEQYPEALLHFEKQAALNAPAEQRGYAALHYAHTLWLLGRYRDAIAALDEAETNAEKFLALRLLVQRERATLALSQGHYSEAAGLALRTIAGDAAQNGHADAEIASILGLALLRSGRLAEALRHCREAVEIASKPADSATRIQARLALVEALLTAGDRPNALRVFHELEPLLAQRPESHWRALALASGADPQYTASAAEALKKLGSNWDDEQFSQYLRRPDIARLSRPLLSSVHANPKKGEIP